MKALLCALLLLWPLSVEAVTRYVDVATAGGDSNSCAASQNAGTPKQHLVGASGAIACMGSGDILLLRAGNYPERIYTDTTPIASGSISAYTTFRAYPGETVWLTGSGSEELVWIGAGTSTGAYIEFDGVNMDCRLPRIGCTALESNAADIHHIRFHNLEQIGDHLGCAPDTPGGSCFMNSASYAPTGTAQGGHEYRNMVIHGGGTNDVSHAIYIGTPNVTIDSNLCYDIAGACFNFYPGAPYNQNSVISNNIVHDPIPNPVSTSKRRFGLSIYGENMQVFNNVIYNIPVAVGGYASWAIYLGGSATVDHNTLYNVVDGIVGGPGGPFTARNNIVYLASGQAMAGMTTSSNNSVAGGNPNFASTTSTDPNFLHLSASSTADIDTATCLGTVTSDKDGTARPQGAGCDRGAYEYTVLGPLPGIPANLFPVSGASNVDPQPTLTFTSTNATAYDFYFSSFNGQSAAFYTDLFDRANASDLGALWTPYTVGYTNAQILNNRVRNTSATVESLESAVGCCNPDQWARVRLSTFGSGYVTAGLMLRLQGGAQPSGYFIGAVSGHASGYKTWAYRYNSGAYQFLAGEMTTPWAANDLMEAHIVGNTITIYRNGNTDLRLTAQDPGAIYTSGTVGISLTASTIGQLEVDTFEAGDIGPVFQGTFSTASWATPALVPGMTYYWKPAGRNVVGVTEGPVVSFTVTGTAAVPVGIRVRLQAP